MADILRLDRTPFSKAQGAGETEAAIAEATRMRIEALKRRIAERPRIAKPSERAMIATNLFRLLERLEKEIGIKKITVLAHTGLRGAPTDSTKRLYTHTLPPDLTGEERTRRTANLVQRVSNYLRLANAAASAAREEPDAYLEEVFRGSSYEIGNKAIPDEIAAPWVAHLRNMIHQMSDWIIRRNRLDRYFATLCDGEVGFVEDGLSGKCIPLESRVMRPNQLIATDRVGPSIPSILINEQKLDTYKGVLFYSRGYHEDEKFNLLRGQFDRPPEGYGPSESFRADCIRELRISIAPMGKNNNPIPVFEIRIVTKIYNESDNFVGEVDGYIINEYMSSYKEDIWRHNFFYRPDKYGFYDELDVLYFKIDGFDGNIRRDPRVSLSGCRYYMIVDLSSTYEQLGKDCFDLAPWSGIYYGEQDILTEAPKFSIAEAVEMDLYRQEEENRIDTLLDKHAALLVGLLDDFQSERTTALEAAKARLRERWKSN